MCQKRLKNEKHEFYKTNTWKRVCDNKRVETKTNSFKRLLQKQKVTKWKGNLSK